MKPIILVLTHTKDDCASMVIDKIKNLNANVVRLDTDTFHKDIKCSMYLDAEGKFNGSYTFSDSVISFDQVSTVWNRRIHDPEIDKIFSDPELIEWSKEETFWAMNISFTMFQCPVVNPWEVNERLKFNKIFQMRKAAEIGFEVPESCITDEKSSIFSFWNKVGQEMIFKKIRKGLFYLSNGQRVILHTNKISHEKFNEESVERMVLVPIFLQRHIPKKYDVRSIVVGDSIFSFAIHSQEIPEGKIDYRTPGVLGRIRDMKHELIDLGEDINKKILKFVNFFGLTFSALDFIITPDDRIVFLEDNPNGQWAWLEQITNVPIAERYAQKLVQLGEQFIH